MIMICPYIWRNYDHRMSLLIPGVPKDNAPVYLCFKCGGDTDTGFRCVKCGHSMQPHTIGTQPTDTQQPQGKTCSTCGRGFLSPQCGSCGHKFGWQFIRYDGGNMEEVIEALKAMKERDI